MAFRKNAKLAIALFAGSRKMDFPGQCGEPLAHFRRLSLEGDGALEVNRPGIAGGILA